jgi:hypothetical protein
MNCQECQNTGTVFEARQVYDDFGTIEDIYDRWCDCAVGSAQKAEYNHSCTQRKLEEKLACEARGEEYIPF